MCFPEPELEGIPTSNEPVHRVRMGRIRAAVWENGTQNGPRYNVTFTRLYKAGAQWRDSGSFGRDDLPLLAKVADQAHTWIFQQKQDDTADSKEAL